MTLRYITDIDTDSQHAYTPTSNRPVTSN